MAKNRNKNRKNSGAGAAAMDIVPDQPLDAPQAVDTSEGDISSHALKPASGKIKKVTRIRRSKNLKKRKARARAISNIEKSTEKVSRSKSKVLRVQSAKSLYD